MRVNVGLIGILVASGAAWAAVEETATVQARVSATDHLIFSNQKDADEPDAKATSLFMHEDQASLEYGRYGLGVSISNRVTPDGNKELNKPIVLEKAFVTATLGDFELVGGDSHQELGKGIALSLYRDGVFGVDNTVQGAAVRMRTEAVDARAFGGRVHALTAPVSVNALPSTLTDRDVWMGATSVTGKLDSSTRIGAHYMGAVNQPKGKASDQIWHTPGVFVEKADLLPGVDVYGESNLLVSRLLQNNQAMPTGYGSYVSATWSEAPWRAKLEGKDYRSYDFEFRRPPTLEEDIVESINIQDVTAARLVGEHRSMETKTSYLASYLVGNDRLAKSTVHHGVVGTKFPLVASVEMELRAGYRTMPAKNDLTHGLAKIKIPTFSHQSLELGARKQYANLNLDLRASKEDKNLFDLTYVLSQSFQVALGYEFVPSNDPSNGRDFFNGGVTYRSGGFSGRAFVGKTSGGTLCSGGVCRRVPPYSGALLETTYLF